MESKDQDRLESDHCRAFDLLWRNLVLVKIKAFGWRIFLNKVATKDQLKKRGSCLPLNDRNCVMCSQPEEDLNHILFDCLFSSKVWVLVGDWSGCGISYVGNTWKHFLSWCEMTYNQSRKGKSGLIWLAVVWSILKVKNYIIFNNAKCNLNDNFENIKFLALKLSCIGEIPYSNSNFYDFSMSPFAYAS